MRLWRKPAEPTRVGDAVYVGSVWTNGDPILGADAADAAGWQGSERYDELLESLHGAESAASGSLELGDGSALVFKLEFDDGTLDAFALGGNRLLLLGIVFGDEDDWEAFVEAALAAPREQIGSIRVRTGRLALFPSASDWEELERVSAEPQPAPKKRDREDAYSSSCPRRSTPSASPTSSVTGSACKAGSWLDAVRSPDRSPASASRRP